MCRVCEHAICYKGCASIPRTRSSGISYEYVALSLSFFFVWQLALLELLLANLALSSQIFIVRSLLVVKLALYS